MDQYLPKCGAIHEFGREIVNGSNLSETIDSENVGMIQGGSGTCLVLKALQPGGFGAELIGQQLERHFATQLYILRQEDGCAT